MDIRCSINSKITSDRDLCLGEEIIDKIVFLEVRSLGPVYCSEDCVFASIVSDVSVPWADPLPCVETVSVLVCQEVETAPGLAVEGTSVYTYPSRCSNVWASMLIDAVKDNKARLSRLSMSAVPACDDAARGRRPNRACADSMLRYVGCGAWLSSMLNVIRIANYKASGVGSGK